MSARVEMLLCLGLATAVARAAESKSPAAAKVQNAAKETALSTIELTPSAEQRLGIVLAEVSRKKVGIARLFGGDVIVPLAPKGETPTGHFPLASSTPDELLRLSDQQAVADGEIEKSRVRLEAAQLTYKRAQRLLQEDAGSVRAVEDAEARVRLAEKLSKSPSSAGHCLARPWWKRSAASASGCVCQPMRAN